MTPADLIALLDRVQAALLASELSVRQAAWVELLEAMPTFVEFFAAAEEWTDALQEFANDGKPENFFRYDAAEQRWRAVMGKIE